MISSLWGLVGLMLASSILGALMVIFIGALIAILFGGKGKE